MPRGPISHDMCFVGDCHTHMFDRFTQHGRYSIGSPCSQVLWGQLLSSVDMCLQCRLSRYASMKVHHECFRDPQQSTCHKTQADSKSLSESWQLNAFFPWLLKLQSAT
eukprot:2776435-Amphidinium_carterae.2